MLNLVYTWCLERIDPKDIDNWKADLMAPLDPDAEPTESDLEAEGDLFMANLALFGGPSQ